MSNTYDVFLDADALVGLYFPGDPHHEACRLLLEYIISQNWQPITSNLVVGETATVLSNRQGQELARQFLGQSENHAQIFIDEQLHRETMEFFDQQTKRGTSFVDCSNIVVMRELNIPYIFSFDQAYEKQFGVEMLRVG